MTQKKGLLEKVGNQPTTALMFIYWLGQSIIGAAILLPTYVPETGTPALAALGNILVIKAYGALMLIPGSVGLYYLWNSHSLRADKVKTALTLWSFVLFTYFTLIRLLSFGPGQLIWVAYALCASTMGVLHLSLKWKGR